MGHCTHRGSQRSAAQLKSKGETHSTLSGSDLQDVGGAMLHSLDTHAAIFILDVRGGLLPEQAATFIGESVYLCFRPAPDSRPTRYCSRVSYAALL